MTAPRAAPLFADSGLNRRVKVLLSVGGGLLLSNGVLLALAPDLALSFPVAQKQTAFALLPKLLRDEACLSRFHDASFAASYAVTYANLLIWACVSGFLAGILFGGIAVMGMRRRLQPDAVPSTPLQIRRFATGVALGFLFAALFLGISFHWSICYQPGPGTSEGRVVAGMYAAPMFAAVACVFIGSLPRQLAFRLTYRR